jgi:hypothetical protein
MKFDTGDFGFDEQTAPTMKKAVLRFIMPYSWEKAQYVGKTYRLHLLGFLCNPEDGCDISLRNVLFQTTWYWNPQDGTNDIGELN